MSALAMTPLWKIDTRAPEGSAWTPGRIHDVLIVGAGITGLATGVMLLRAGRDVTILEAGTVGALASGANTGKVSLLQGNVLSTLRRHHPAALVRAYVDANRDGAEWITAFAAEAGVPLTRRTAYSFAQTSDGAECIAAEAEAAREAGLPVREADPASDLPFPVAAAIALDDQAALDPYALVVALARTFLSEGGTLHTGVRVTSLHTGLPVAGPPAKPKLRVDTTEGSATARELVLATATPLVDRGLYFAKTRGLRSLCVAFDVDGDVPEGLYLSVDAPTRSIRSVTDADGPAARARLIVGGNGHPVGRTPSVRAQFDDLQEWTQHHFPGARAVARWAAQDYESHDLIPFIGAMPRTLGRVRFATGYGKWGMSLGPAAAMRLTNEITRVPRRDWPSWMSMIARRFTVPADLGRGGVENLKVGWQAAAGWAGAEQHAVPVTRPAEGEAVVANRAGVPVGISTVDGTTRAVTAVCSHLGGVLTWNDAERSWDCPLHSSRFAPDGTRIEGPALADLRRLARVPGEQIEDAGSVVS